MVKAINPMFDDSDMELIKKAKGSESYARWIVEKAKEDLAKKEASEKSEQLNEIKNLEETKEEDYSEETWNKLRI